MATMNLCSLDDVKTSPALDKLRQATPDNYDEEYITNLIRGFSDAAERMTGRKFRKNTYTEIFSPECGQSVVQLSAFPVISITSVKQDYVGDFASVASDDLSWYALPDGGVSGILRCRDGEFLEGDGSLQIVYVGGYDENDIPYDLRMAAVDQVAFQFKAATTVELSAAAEQGSQTQYRAIGLLPHVAGVLHRYSILKVW
jgi:hypothetical protein